MNKNTKIAIGVCVVVLVAVAYVVMPKQSGLEYRNTDYGFRVALPDTWKGYTATIDTWTGSASNDQLGEVPFAQGPVVSIHNPKWTAAKPYQDIPIMVFTLAQWSDLEADKFHIGAAPIGPSELARNAKYVFALPARYNFAFPPGYEEVDQILESKPLTTITPATLVSSSSSATVPTSNVPKTPPSSQTSNPPQAPSSCDGISNTVSAKLNGQTIESLKLVGRATAEYETINGGRSFDLIVSADADNNKTEKEIFIGASKLALGTQIPADASFHVEYREYDRSTTPYTYRIRFIPEVLQGEVKTLSVAAKPGERVCGSFIMVGTGNYQIGTGYHGIQVSGTFNQVLPLPKAGSN